MPPKNSKAKKVVVPNQVFIGCPWKTIRPKYERVVGKLGKSYPLSYVIVGRDKEQNAEDLLTVIRDKLLTSSHAIFDATGGNANVSLEYGLAEAEDIPRVLYLCTHGAAKRSSTDQPIISDLAGKQRMQYAQEERLLTLLRTLSKQHSYTLRFERFLTTKSKRKSKGDKKRARSLALKVIHSLDEKDIVRREDIVLNLQADVSAYKEVEIDQMIRALHQAGLIMSSRGRYSQVSMV
ncbi:hypothetical protein EPO44_00545 [bacterium]|nr:MAG: hypothetical protein EPO44_00545 [bacterium]